MGKSLAAAISFFVLTASAAWGGGLACAPGAPGAAAPSLTLQEANELLRPVGKVTAVRPAPVEGLWLIELEREGRQGQAFLDYARKNLIVGTVFPLSGNAGGEPATQPRDGKVDLNAISLENSVVMGNPAATRKLVVFTDPDCPYCAKLHEELKKLVSLEPDLAVLVKLYPLHIDAYPKARVILGSKSLDMLDKAFNGLPLPQPGAGDSKQPVVDTMALGRSLGITATPTLVLPDGEMVTGTMDVASLRNLLSLHEKQ